MELLTITQADYSPELLIVRIADFVQRHYDVSRTFELDLENVRHYPRDAEALQALDAMTTQVIAANGHLLIEENGYTLVVDPWPIAYAIDDETGDQIEVTDYLLTDGNLKVPSSRYASDSNDVAQVCSLLWDIYAEALGDNTVIALDGLASMIVNDADEIVDLFNRFGIYYRPWVDEQFERALTPERF